MDKPPDRSNVSERANGPDEPLGPERRAAIAERRSAIRWRRQWQVVTLAVVALLVGGAIGYAVGHSNAQTKTKSAKTGSTGSTGVTGLAAVKTITTAGKTVTLPGKTITKPGKTVTLPGKTITRTVTATQTETATVTASSTAAPAGTQSFSGANTQNLGTIQVSGQSLLRWSCAGCGGSTFTITNGSSDPGTIGVNAKSSTSGETAVAAGTYTDVTATGSGPWTFTIAPGGG